MHFYYDKSNQVVMRSDGPIDAPQFRHVEISVDEIEHTKLIENWKPRIVDNMLELEMPEERLNEQRQTEKENAIQSIKERISKQKDQDTRDLLADIMKLISP